MLIVTERDLIIPIRYNWKDLSEQLVRPVTSVFRWDKILFYESTFYYTQLYIRQILPLLVLTFKILQNHS